ncbi:MAG: lytic transglycosylase domain-containing protein [Actinomycetes bacterium]
MLQKFRNPSIAVVVAFGQAILATVDTSFAQTSLSREVTLPDLPTQTVATSPALEPGLLDLGNVPSVNAHVMALVSLQAKQVQLAKTPVGAKAVAADLIAANYSKWNSSQISCLDQLWNNESHWNFKAHNYRSGAHGIPQALPADKMAVISPDWRTNPVTQIRWGLRYINARYGSPCAALRRQHGHHGY